MRTTVSSLLRWRFVCEIITGRRMASETSLREEDQEWAKEEFEL
jgi:hypothetical protein